MRRPLLALLALLAVLAVPTAAAAGGSDPASSDLPPGFTDGRPVGGDDPEPATSARAATTADVNVAASTQRYFGRAPFDAVKASVAATPRTCTISDEALTGLVLAPVFKESSAAASPSTAPSPMTLSRYDEWNGTYSTTSNVSANYGLYAFRDPYTDYLNAYWHPGLGIWQHDSAGIGAPLTTIEAMDVRTASADVAKGVVTRYCAATGAEQSRRYAAWSDWGNPCTLCEQFFQEMMTASPRFANITRVDGIGVLGGVVERTCSLAGVAGTMRCWYVKPSVGTIQGSTAWATFSPDGGSGPTVAPAPLSDAFYVLDRGATEERHWLRADTGYDIDISAVRTIGKNARPRSNQTGSGLTWRSTSGLCDLTLDRGNCGGPAGMSEMTFAVNATDYRPVALDADGDGDGDVLWYRPGSADSLWRATGPATFATSSVSIPGTYTSVLTGQIDGTAGDDVVFYSATSGAALLWRSNGTGGFTSSTLSMGAGRVPFLLDSNADGKDELVWFGPGTIPDATWVWTSSHFTATAFNVTKSYRPFVGDFDGNGRQDIFWYAPGSGADAVWFYAQAGGFTSIPVAVNGTYTPITGDFDGDNRTDVFWYGPGSAADGLWFGAPGGSFVGSSASINLTYTPTVLDLAGAGRDAIVWDSATGADGIWQWSAGRTLTTSGVMLAGTHRSAVGPFSAGGQDGVLWYAPGAGADDLWYR